MKSKGKIRLAVIGSTSSGKTYLLRDIIESLSRCGYQCNNKLGHLYASPYEFCQKLQNESKGQGEVLKTPVVQCRAHNEYRGKFKDKRSARGFELGFLDIPGESITPEAMTTFTKIVNGLYRLGRYFKYDVYVRGVESSKVLRYVGPSGDALESEKYHTIIQAYEKGEYKKRNFSLPMSRNVSGKEIVTNFFDYDTDSVIEAIAQAIPLFEESQGVKQSDFIQTSQSKDFFYIIYALYATDVVLCDKVVMPSDLSDSSVVTNSESPILQLQQLYNTSEFKPGKKKYYMAFRGADSLVKNRLSDLIEWGMKLDHIYAFIIYLLEYKLTGKNVYAAQREDYLGPVIHKYLNEKAVKECVEKYLKDEYSIQPYYNQGTFGEYCTGKDLDKELKARMNLAIKDFEKIRSEYGYDTEMFMAPNVFLTSSAIADKDYDFEVSGNSATNVRAMEGNCAYPERRACFGTLQLTKSLLIRNNVRLYDDDQDDLIDLIEKAVN